MKRLVVLALFAAACGGKSTPQTTPPPGGEGAGSATPTAKAPLPDVPFDELSHEQRGQFMEEKVVPAMAPLFKAHDAEEFAEFGCKTCHGASAEKGEFHMPNPELPVLDFSDMSKWKKEDLEWMTKVIKPTMAGLLKETEMSKENPQGFGCTDCHTTKQK